MLRVPPDLGGILIFTGIKPARNERNNIDLRELSTIDIWKLKTGRREKLFLKPQLLVMRWKGTLKVLLLLALSSI